MLDDYSIDFVFEELNRIGQCRGRSDFSIDWLHRNESYYRSIQSKGRAPSVGAQLFLASRLRDLGMHLAKSDHPKLVATGNTYLKLYGECLDDLLNRAQSDAFNSEYADYLAPR
jgi:hypothetical protein